MSVILFVDDERAFREESSKLLRKKGHSVVEAGSASEALTAAHDNSIDGVVISALLADSTGTDLLERLRASHPRVPALFVCDLTRYDVERRGLLPAGVAFLRKPFPAEALVDAVADLLVGVRSRRS